MTKEEFKKFVEKKERESESVTVIDWDAQKKAWLKHLAQFYSRVEEYLREYTGSGRIKVETVQVQLNEQNIGRYDADSKILQLGADTIVLKPIGTFLIAAKGRVDMEGPRGTIKFILTDKDSNGIRIRTRIGDEKEPASLSPEGEEKEELVWKIATAPPKIQFIDLTPETFFDALMEVANG